MTVPLALLVVAGLVWLLLRRHRRGGRTGDGAAWIAAAAVDQLPAGRRDWGRAMAAELAQVHGRARWWFTVGVLRVVLFPPSRHPARAGAVALAGLVVTAAATVAAAREVPTMSLFAAVLGLLLCGYATVVASRSEGLRPTAPRVIVGTVALAGVAAAIVTVARIAVANPAATADRMHVVSVLFALALAVYLALALSPFRLGDRPDTVLWWALGAGLASCAAEILIFLAVPSVAADPAAFVSPAVAVAALAASAGAAAATRSRPAGARAGLLAAILGVLAHFTVSLTAILQLHHYTLAAADIAAYAHSGYPSIASYVIGDTLGGSIASLVLGPVVLLGVALLGAAAGNGLRRSRAWRKAP